MVAVVGTQLVLVPAAMAIVGEFSAWHRHKGTAAAIDDL